MKKWATETYSKAKIMSVLSNIKQRHIEIKATVAFDRPRKANVLNKSQFKISFNQS